MNLKMKGKIVAVALMVGVGGLGLSARTHADQLLSRYPGARPLAPAHLNLSRVGRGWVERQATYHTGADLMTVGQWYVALLDFGPEDEVHNVADCVSLRVVRPVLGIQRTTDVMLCPVAYGTRIAVHETLLLAQ